MGDQSTPAREGQTPTICPYCGGDPGAGAACLTCRGPLDPDSLAATRADLGPWQIRDPARPHLPGCSTARLRALVQRGAVRTDTPIRRDGGLWQAAGRTPGVAPFLGLCPECQAQVHEAMDACSVCQVSLWSADGSVAALERGRGRGGVRTLAGLLALLFLGGALVGGGFAFGTLYQLRTARAPQDAVAPIGEASYEDVLDQEPSPPDPPPRAENKPTPAPPPADPFADVLVAIDEGRFDRAGELIEALARDPALAAEAAAWADLLARQRRVQESATLP